MRCAPTRSEDWLWRRLSGSKTGLAFRRQLVIGERIVDFACLGDTGDADAAAPRPQTTMRAEADQTRGAVPSGHAGRGVFAISSR